LYLILAIYAVIDCSMIQVRKKDDIYNAMAAGGGSFAAMASRQGPQAMLIGGILGILNY
jgi:hypothetical protein